jgi:hypothetical protein
LRPVRCDSSPHGVERFDRCAARVRRRL